MSDGNGPNVFLEINKVTTMVCALCIVSIAITSRDLQRNTWIPKMPLIAAVFWFLSSLFLVLWTANNGTFLGDKVFTLVSLICDFAARCLLLWFTYLRTKAVWRDGVLLTYAAVGIQTAQLAAFAFMLWTTTFANDPAWGDTSLATYSASDLLTGILDMALIGRLAFLNKQVKNRVSVERRVELVKPRFFVMSVVCISLVIFLSVTMAVVVATGNDPYLGFNTPLFAFRILLTDAFSNLIRESLLEARAQSMASQQHTLDKMPTHGRSMPSKARQSRHASVLESAPYMFARGTRASMSNIAVRSHAMHSYASDDRVDIPTE